MPRIRPSRGIAHHARPRRRSRSRPGRSSPPAAGARSSRCRGWGRRSSARPTTTTTPTTSTTSGRPRTTSTTCWTRSTPTSPPTLGRADVTGAYAGVRPLISTGDPKKSVDISRKAELYETSSGMITITGGKLTTWRRMAKMAVDRLVEREARTAPCRTHEIPLGQPVDAARPAAGRGRARGGLRAPRRPLRPRGPRGPRGGRARAASWPSRSCPAGRPTCWPRPSTRRAASRRVSVGDALLRRTRVGPARRARRRRPRGRDGAARRGGDGAPSWGGTSAHAQSDAQAFLDEAARRRHRHRSVTFSTLAGCIPATGPVDPQGAPPVHGPPHRPARRARVARPARRRRRRHARALLRRRRRSTVRARTSSRSATSTSRATAPARWPTSSASPASTTSSSRGWSTAPSRRPSRSTPAWPAPARSRSSPPRTAAGSSWPSSAAAASSPRCARPGRRATPRRSRSPTPGREPGGRHVDQRRGLPHLVAPAATCWRARAGAQRDDVQRRARRRWTSTRPRRPAPAPGGRRSRSPPTASPPWCGARAATSTRGGSSSCACRPRRRTSAHGRRRARHLQRGRLELRLGRVPPGRRRRIARRLVGSQFDPPVADRGRRGRPTRRASPSTAAASATRASAGRDAAGAYGAVLKDDVFNPGVVLGGGFGAAPAPVPAVAESGDGLVAFQQGDAERRALDPRAPLRLRARVAGRHRARARRDALRPGARADRRRARPRGRAPTAPATSPSPSSRATATRAGSSPASYDRAPGAFRASTTTKWRKFARPPLKWGTAFELWGPLTYRVRDRRPAGGARPTSTGLTVPTAVARRAAPLAGGRHRHPRPDRRRRRRATCASTPRRRRSRFKVSGTRKRGKQVKVAVQATDASGTARQGLGAERRADRLRRRLADRRRAAGRPTATGTRARSPCASARPTRRATPCAVTRRDHDRVARTRACSALQTLGRRRAAHGRRGRAKARALRSACADGAGRAARAWWRR